MMDNRDDWPDGILVGDKESSESRDATERQSAERIARNARNMNAVLSAMTDGLSEGLPPIVEGETALGRRREAGRWRAMIPFAAAAVVVAVLLARGSENSQNGDPLVPPPESRARSMVSEMDVEADGPFVVFPTSDPDIAVVWLLNPTEDE